MDTRNILALDVSSMSTGYALFSNGICIKSGAATRKSKKGQDWLFRVRSMIEEIQLELESYDIDVLVVENSYRGFSVSTLKVLCLAQGLFLGAFLENRELLFVYPKEWQAYYKLASLKRDKIKENSIRIANELTELTTTTDDEADAIVLANYVVNREIKANA